MVLLRFSKGDDQMAACGQLGELGERHVPLLRVPDQFLSAVGREEVTVASAVDL